MSDRPPPIKVLHVITRLIVGGAQENTLFTAIGQHRDPRYDVTLLAGFDGGPEGDLHGEARAAGVRLVLLPALVRPIRPWTDFVALAALGRFMRAERFDIVHTHSSKAGILGRLAARMVGVPVVVHTLHSLVFHEYEAPWKNRLYILLKRLVAPITDVLISVSDKTAEGAIAAGIGRRSQHVTIFSGMELAPFVDIARQLSVEEAKRRAGIPADAPVVGKVARLFPLKGHRQFFDVARQVAAARPDAYFLLVGDGVLRGELEALAHEMGIADRTVFTGLVASSDVPALMQAMDVVVHSSLREGIARVLPQASAVGRPIVTFDLDGAPEVIRDGASGYLVPPLDTALMAERVLELLHDPDKRRRFGAVGRSFALEHFGADRMVARIDEVYVTLLARRSRRHAPDRRGGRFSAGC